MANYICMSKRPSDFLIQVEFLTFQQGLSITGHAIQILLAAQNYITEVLDSTDTDCGLKIPSCQSPSLTMKESVFPFINQRISQMQFGRVIFPILNRYKNNRVQITIVTNIS